MLCVLLMATQESSTSTNTARTRAAMQEQQCDSSPHPFRLRTVTAFLQLPPDTVQWEPLVAAAGAFLALAQQHLQSLGYEVQTLRIATQPFPEFLAAAASSSSSSSACDGGCGDDDDDDPTTPQQSSSQQVDALLVKNAVFLEGLAARHGIPLLSIGSSSDPQHLQAIPQIIAATSSTSCTFALPAEPRDWGLGQQVAQVVMEVSRLTGGMGNFRFASCSNMQPGIPYFPVACCGPQQHNTFAIGTEPDALLHMAFTQAVAAAEAQQQVGATNGSCGTKNVMQLAAQQLHEVLLQHWAPLEAAALHIEDHLSGAAEQGFRYLGLDTSLAPGLDTPALTDSYQLLLRGLHLGGPASVTAAAGAAGVKGAGAGAAAAAGGAGAAGAGGGSSGNNSASAAGFGGPGCLTVSSLITQVLKGLPLRLTGYCGLMLAVCEDQGLAAAAAAGDITISQLLQYSAVCGCGLDTVPVPGPAAAAAATADGGGDGKKEQQQQLTAAAAQAQDALTTAAIAGLISDVNTLAHRLNKPLACRLLPLPGKMAGQPTGFVDHPYMINSSVMDLHK